MSSQHGGPTRVRSSKRHCSPAAAHTEAPSWAPGAKSKPTQQGNTNADSPSAIASIVWAVAGACGDGAWAATLVARWKTPGHIPERELRRPSLLIRLDWWPRLRVVRRLSVLPSAASAILGTSAASCTATYIRHSQGRRRNCRQASANADGGGSRATVMRGNTRDFATRAAGAMSFYLAAVLSTFLQTLCSPRSLTGQARPWPEARGEWCCVVDALPPLSGRGCPPPSCTEKGGCKPADMFPTLLYSIGA